MSQCDILLLEPRLTEREQLGSLEKQPEEQNEQSTSDTQAKS